MADGPGESKESMPQPPPPSALPEPSAADVIRRLAGFLEERPTDFAIAILPSTTTTTAAPSPSSGPSLEEAIVLVEDGGNGDSGGPANRGRHLGLDGRALPWVTRLVRGRYAEQRRQLMIAATPRTAAEGGDPHGGSSNIFAASSSSAASEAGAADHGSSPAVLWTALHRTTSCLLLVNPYHATAWADRRRALHVLAGLTLEEGRPDIGGRPTKSAAAPSVPAGAPSSHHHDDDRRRRRWEDELDFLDLLMTQHSKA